MRGTDTPRVEELPQGDENSRVTPKGNIIPVVEGQGQGGDGNSPATRDTKGSGNNSRGGEMESGQEPATLQIPQQGTSEDGRGDMRLYMHPVGADVPRPKHSMLARCKYGLLTLEEPAGDPAVAEPHGSGDIPEVTPDTGCTDRRETRTWERNGQRAVRLRPSEI